MKTITLYILVILLISQEVFATHIVGGEMYYDCISENQYEVTLIIYRECGPDNSNNTDFDNPARIGVFDENDSLVDLHHFSLLERSNIPAIINDPCYNAPPDLCAEKGVYKEIITLPDNDQGYRLVYQRCCRNPAITNIVDPYEMGSSYQAYIPPGDVVECNSSPRFNDLPPLVICNEIPFVFEHAASDPDGDEIVYEFFTPYHGASFDSPAPQQPSPPPYTTVQWEIGHDVENQIPGTPSLTVDENTGLLTCTPNTQGIYVFGVVAKEYRDGELISESYREFQTTVTTCPPNIIASAPEQSSFCHGLDIQMENHSVNAEDFFWDFGDPNNPNSTSTDFEPQYEYSEPGTYTIMLIAGYGLTCADTAYYEYMINPPIDAFFEVDEPMCINNQNFNFTAEGNFDSTATVEWDFGESASISTAYGIHQDGINFPSDGKFPVKIYVEFAGCSDTYEDTVEVIPLPEVNFVYPDQEGCAPYTIQFIDSSKTQLFLDYHWDFGDGSTSTEQNPTHTYENPGIYSVSLTATVDSICTFQETFTLDNIILVNPTPEAILTSNKIEESIYTPTITFYNQTSNISEFEISVEDIITNQSPYKHAFQESGEHKALLWVINEFGCTDTDTLGIFIIPDTRIFIPNAFTPDGDGINDIFLPIVRDIIEYELLIYNRHGHLIFQTVNTDQGWNGTHNGKPVQDGVYVYKVIYRDWKNKKGEKYGHVSLLR